MTIDVVVYISSVANARKHTRKIACLESFAVGAKKLGASVVTEWDYRYTPSRLAVMLGWATTNTGGRNISLRKQIIADQARLGGRTMCIDASCWKYIDNQGTYLRYSIGGPFYERAEYANRHSDATKWNEIRQRLNLHMNQCDNATHNGHILIGMQRDGGFAMKTLNPIEWLHAKLPQIRQYSQRPIMIRPHPGAYRMEDFESFRRMAGVTVIDPATSSLQQNLQNAHAAVFFNSSASVAAVMANVPVFADDASCVSWQVANHDLAMLENPAKFDRSQWVYDLAAAHWSDEDGSSGRIYQKFLPYITATVRS